MAVATKTRPEEIRRRVDTDFYTWQSWHSRGAFRGMLDPESAMKDLCETTEEGWAHLRKKLASKERFPNATLAKMRELMTLPAADKDQPWIDPTQEWVADQIRMFFEWYVKTFGEPKLPKIEPIKSE